MYKDGNTTGDGNTTDDGDETKEIECKTSWGDEKYKIEVSDSWYDSLTNLPNNIDAVYDIVKDFFTGLVEGFGNQVSDLVNILLDPSILWDIAKAAMDDPIGFVEDVVKGVLDDIEKVMVCGPGEIGTFIGENANPVVFLKVISNLAGSTRLAKYADDVEGRPKDSDGNYIDEGGDIDGVTCNISSFVAGTQVAIPGGQIAIENVQVGTAVHARNELDFFNAPQKVTKAFGRVAKGYSLISTEFGTIKATSNHPFWVQGAGWTEAKNLKGWDSVASLKGDTLIKESIYIREDTRVYNFTVENSHNYFVGDGGLWVHNCPPPKIPGTLPHAKEAIDALPKSIGDNLFAFVNNKGLVIVKRRDINSSQKYEYRNDKLDVATNNIDVPAVRTALPKLTHADLGPSMEVDLDLRIAGKSVTLKGNVKTILEDLTTERNAAVKKRDDAIDVGDNEGIKQAIQEMANASEQLGEVASQAYIKKNFEGATKLDANTPSNGKQGEFDQIYLHKGRLILVEAKGGNATLTSRKDLKGMRAEQGSSSYMETVIQNYRKQLENVESGKTTVTPTEKANLEATVKAFDDYEGEIDYYSITQKATQTIVDGKTEYGISDSIDVVKFTL